MSLRIVGSNLIWDLLLQVSDNNLTNPSGNQPIFRSWLPSTSSTRVFPQTEDLLAGTTTIGEHLPTYSRDLTFRLTVRDNKAGGGGGELRSNGF
ncbi:MAG: hypothetical protein CM15mP107_1340 [Bacteroidota bacterium]|nr:MAG: hypothetical protein CM15mP107_1340 [Bacteroidota bacterium]